MRRQSMQKYQGISILFFSRQSKARDQHLVFLTSKQSKAKTSCERKMVDKTVDQERENQCKAENFKIKETSSAQCPVGLKGRRPHAPRGSTVPHQYNAEMHLEEFREESFSGNFFLKNLFRETFFSPNIMSFGTQVLAESKQMPCLHPE